MEQLASRRREAPPVLAAACKRRVRASRNLPGRPARDESTPTQAGAVEGTRGPPPPHVVIVIVAVVEIERMPGGAAGLRVTNAV